MANEYEMYDYLSVATPDYNYILDIKPQAVIVEDGRKNVKIKEYDDTTETRIIKSNATVFYVTLQFNYLSESDAGIIFDLYHNTSKGIGTKQSFAWNHYGEPTGRRHRYVVRFAEPLSRTIRKTEIYGYSQIRLKVLGWCNAMLIDSVESASTITAPTLTVSVKGIVAENIESSTENSTPTIDRVADISASNVECESEITAASVGDIIWKFEDDNDWSWEDDNDWSWEDRDE